LAFSFSDYSGILNAEIWQLIFPAGWRGHTNTSNKMKKRIVITVVAAAFVAAVLFVTAQVRAVEVFLIPVEEEVRFDADADADALLALLKVGDVNVVFGNGFRIPLPNRFFEFTAAQEFLGRIIADERDRLRVHTDLEGRLKRLRINVVRRRV